MAHALACADARRGWVHPSRIDDRHGHHVIAHRCHRRCTHRQPQDDGGHGTTIAREPGRPDHVLVRGQRRAKRGEGGGRPGYGRLCRLVHHARHVPVLLECAATSGGLRVRNGVERRDPGDTVVQQRPPIVVAHFAGAARPNVSVAYDSSTPPVPLSVTMRFTKPSDCTLDCTYTLFGSRRSYNPASVTTGGNPLPGDVVLSIDRRCEPTLGAGQLPGSGHDDRLHHRSDQDGSADLRRGDDRLVTTPLWTAFE